MVDSQNAIANSILDTIGSTPMIRLHRLNPNPAVDLLAKVEGFNPTGSIKDLGKLPQTAVILLITLVISWLLIGAYVVYRALRKKKA